MYAYACMYVCKTLIIQSLRWLAQSLMLARVGSHVYPQTVQRRQRYAQVTLVQHAVAVEGRRVVSCAAEPYSLCAAGALSSSQTSARTAAATEQYRHSTGPTAAAVARACVCVRGLPVMHVVLLLCTCIGVQYR